jgi:hypothetical protein
MRFAVFVSETGNRGRGLTPKGGVFSSAAVCVVACPQSGRFEGGAFPRMAGRTVGGLTPTDPLGPRSPRPDRPPAAQYGGKTPSAA